MAAPSRTTCPDRPRPMRRGGGRSMCRSLRAGRSCGRVPGSDRKSEGNRAPLQSDRGAGYSGVHGLDDFFAPVWVKYCLPEICLENASSGGHFVLNTRFTQGGRQMHVLECRALRAYLKRAARDGNRADPPSPDREYERIDGRIYVVLRTKNGVLAIYRVRNNGALKGLRRIPKDLGTVI